MNSTGRIPADAPRPTRRNTDGKCRRKVIDGKTRKEVAEKLKKVRHERQRGLPVVVERQTVGQFLERWLRDAVEPGTRPRTFESYSQIVRLYLAPALGRHQLAPQQVQQLLNDLHRRGGQGGTGSSPRTVAYVRAVLRKTVPAVSSIRGQFLARP